MTFLKLFNKIVTKHTALKDAGYFPKKIMLGTDEMDVFLQSLGDTVIEWDKHNMLKKVTVLGCKVGVSEKDGIQIL